jgi:hypothetical protein
MNTNDSSSGAGAGATQPGATPMNRVPQNPVTTAPNTPDPRIGATPLLTVKANEPLVPDRGNYGRDNKPTDSGEE